ncbi:hypothetical protein P7H14_25565 [Paenibacillus larvae]|nr:hypothetical protein [Paenibacillus larvae]
MDPKQRAIKAKAELIRSVMREQSVSIDVRQALGDNDTTGGNKFFLPKTVSTDILVEPTVKTRCVNFHPSHRLRTWKSPNLTSARMTIPIADTETAKEMKADGDTVTFGRTNLRCLRAFRDGHQWFRC